MDYTTNEGHVLVAFELVIQINFYLEPNRKNCGNQKSMTASNLLPAKITSGVIFVQQEH